jgi:uncharacterized protein
MTKPPLLFTLISYGCVNRAPFKIREMKGEILYLLKRIKISNNVHHDQQVILDRIKKIVMDENPTAKVYLYGSRARGTVKENSDWDLLILLNKTNITSEDERKITYPLYDLEFEVGEIISPIVYSEQEWTTKHKITPFYKNIMREGRLL